ncbi:GNAT family N-acetyltransferase [Sinomicrobium weinanense]|uniref:GNAT family N-acetyltransferase n=1 Tax=Sinomicrobium weinanense TaxID=2842200 RepID=A0A926JUZ7_9FLAO|nr:GNAT family N-acetyltransferase [Sinomicrobium weinanense]MBC9797661.1 GNAT family N-acetyltransferase [Sinomicrobium weinanense]MBU3122657.1 GNAT family N-acetyltransferase [Sinomicrobium weinanense]
MDTGNFKLELIPGDKIFTIIPLLRQLDGEISTEILEQRLKGMVEEGYKCLGVYDENKLIGVSGLWILTKYYVGKHIEPDNVVIHSDYRGRGIGKLMMNWIFDYARSMGCDASELNCYVSNPEGVKFWVNSGYKIIGYHFQKKLG